MSLLLGFALAAAAQGTPVATLEELGRTGELMVASGDQPEKREKVLEITVRACNVAFKTKLFPNGFTAKMIDIGEGGKVSRVGRNTVRLDGSTRFPKMSVLVSGRDTRKLFAALETLRKTCETSNQIF
jgi:hypothetical protein